MGLDCGNELAAGSVQTGCRSLATLARGWLAPPADLYCAARWSGVCVPPILRVAKACWKIWS